MVVKKDVKSISRIADSVMFHAFASAMLHRIAAVQHATSRALTTAENATRSRERHDRAKYRG